MVSEHDFGPAVGNYPKDHGSFGYECTMTSETIDKPMVQGKSNIQKSSGRIHWDDERLAQWRRVENQTHPCPYNKDVRGEQVVGVQPSTSCGESRLDQGTRSLEKGALQDKDS